MMFATAVIDAAPMFQKLTPVISRLSGSVDDPAAPYCIELPSAVRSSRRCR